MTITDVKESSDHAQFVANRSGHSWTCPYTVTVDTQRTGPKEIVDYFGNVLNRGIDSKMIYGDERDPFSYCDSIAPTRRSRGGTVWDVVLQYSTPTADEPDQDEWRDRDGNPTRDPFSWKGSMSTATDYIQVPVWKAWNVDAIPFGDCGEYSAYTYHRDADTLGPVVNSAGIVLDPPLTVNMPERMVTITKNVEFWDESYAELNEMHINSPHLTYHHDLARDFELAGSDFEPYTIKCTSVRGQFSEANDGEEVIPYWKVTVELRIRPRASKLFVRDGWLESVLDRGLTRGATEGDPDGHGGTYSLAGDDHVDGSGHGEPVRGPDGSRVGELVLLDGCGQPLGPATYAARTGVYCRWRKHPTTNFFMLPFVVFKFA